MAAIPIVPRVVRSIEPAGLEHCRRHGLGTKFEPHNWSTPSVLHHKELEELLIVGSTVVWTTSTATTAVYGFENEGQVVKQALFAYFPAPHTLFKDRGGEAIPQLGLDIQAQSRVHALNDALKSTANLVHTQNTSEGTITERALVIILEDIAHIYHEDGRRDLVNLPFPIHKAHARDVGIILERQMDALDFPKMLHSQMDVVPKFFVLKDPLEHLGIVSPNEAWSSHMRARDMLCHVDDQYFITYNTLLLTVTIWFIQAAEDTNGSLQLKPSSNGQLTRRRSSMRTSLIGLTRIGDLAKTTEEQATVNHADLTHVERMPFTDIDPNTLFNTSQNLRKDLILHSPEAIQGFGATQPSVYCLPMSPTSDIVYLHCPDSQVLIELTIRKRYNGAHSIQETRRDLIKSIAMVRLNCSQAFVLQSPDDDLWLQMDSGLRIAIQCLKVPRAVQAYGASSFILQVGADEAKLMQFRDASGCPECMRLLRAFREFMTVSHFALFCTTLLQSTILLDLEQTDLQALLTAVFACFTSERPESDSHTIPQDTFDFSIMQRVDLAARLTRSSNLIELRSYLPQILLSLHFISEELSLSIFTTSERAQILPCLLQLATWLQWSQYAEYYSQEMHIEQDLVLDEALTHLTIAEPQSGPTSIIRWVLSLMSGSHSACMTLDALLLKRVVSSAHHSDGDLTETHICPMTNAIAEIFLKLTDTTSTIHELIDLMMLVRISNTTIDNLPRALAVPLRDVIYQSALAPASYWKDDTLKFIGRADLTKSPVDLKSTAHVERLVRNAQRSADDGKITLTPATSAHTITDMIFDQDRRRQEVEKILNHTRPTIVQWNTTEHYGEAELIRQQDKLAKVVAMRTLAIPVGRAMFDFDSHHPIPTRQFPLPKINFEIKIKPAQVTVSEDKNFMTDSMTFWPSFHTGVAAGLSIARSAQEISASWIVFNRPEELTNGHAGFLLGLGLNGHLKAMATWHAFNYLTAKHNMTSIGLLLGLSASFLGTRDPMVTKLLSVHILALLPPGSNELNLSGITQAAGVVGIGLLYFSTGQSSMSEAMLKEIVETDKSAEPFRDESYRLAAGIALGMINVGQGCMIQGVKDPNMEPKLMRCVQGHDREADDLDVKMPGALIALSLIYLRTNDRFVAERLRVPRTRHRQAYIRPDLYLLRSLARGLIMWNDISATFQYVKDELPDTLKTAVELAHLTYHDSRNLMLLNIVVGSCLAIGIKFAGSLDEQSRDFVLAYLDKFMRMLAVEDHGVDHKSSRIAIRTHAGVLCLAASLIMAGSGDLQVLRRLRRLHYRLDQDIWYGNYMAVEMATGLLFLSGGQKSLCTTDLAICSFVAAFYPVLPNTTTDNLAHLQALRHLWALGTEPRCLYPKDTASGEICSVPFQVHFKDTQRPSLQIAAPWLLPPLHTIHSIDVNTSDYWPVSLQFVESQQHLEAFRVDQTVYVTRRTTGDAEKQKLNLSSKVHLQEIQDHKDMVADISSILQNRVRIDTQALHVAFQADEDWHWNVLSSRAVLLNSLRAETSMMTLQSFEVLFAYWQASTSGFLSHKFSASAERCLDEEIIEQLRLEVWKRSEGMAQA